MLAAGAALPAGPRAVVAALPPGAVRARRLVRQDPAPHSAPDTSVEGMEPNCNNTVKDLLAAGGYVPLRALSITDSKKLDEPHP